MILTLASIAMALDQIAVRMMPLNKYWNILMMDING